MEKTLLVEIARIANNLQRIATKLEQLTTVVEQLAPNPFTGRPA